MGVPLYISFFYNDQKNYNTFCLKPTSDISIFYIDESKINQNFYKGKTIEYILNNESDNFYINNTFIINGDQNYIFDIDAVSFQITNIINEDKGEIYNGNEKLNINSFFNAKTKSLIHKKKIDEGYLMIINIITKPRNQKSNKISTCEIEAKIYLYVSQKNCSMNEFSNNYCQKCKKDYKKFKNNCYHKSKKIK